MLFQTSRLIVRPLTETDHPAFHEMQSNPKVMRHVSGQPQNEAESWLDLLHLIQCYTQEGNLLWVWAIERKMDAAFVGTCAIADEDHNIGYRFLEKYWGNGYGQEVTDALIEFALNDFGLSCITAYVDVENLPSVKILERSKMQFVKEFYNEKEGCVDRFYRLDK